MGQVSKCGAEIHNPNGHQSDLTHSLPFTTAVSGAAQIMGDLVTGRVAETKGQNLSIPFDEHDGAGKFNYILDVLRWRAQSSPDSQLFSVVDSKVCVCK